MRLFCWLAAVAAYEEEVEVEAAAPDWNPDDYLPRFEPGKYDQPEVLEYPPLYSVSLSCRSLLMRAPPL